MSDSDTSERDRIRERKAEELRRRLGDDDAGADATADAGAASSRDDPVRVTGPDHLAELIDEGGVVLVDFYADWCGPCKTLEPIVADVAAETAATVAKVDVDAQQRLAQRYNVRGVPTMVIFAGGEQVEQVVGVRGKDDLVGLVERYAAA